MYNVGAARGQMMSDHRPLQEGFPMKVCEDCGRSWEVECDSVDFNLSIDLHHQESPPLFLTILREVSSPTQLCSPARLTCVVVGAAQADRFIFKWKVNHNGSGTPAYSGCQIAPILTRSDCNTKDSQETGSDNSMSYSEAISTNLGDSTKNIDCEIEKRNIIGETSNNSGALKSNYMLDSAVEREINTVGKSSAVTKAIVGPCNSNRAVKEEIAVEDSIIPFQSSEVRNVVPSNAAAFLPGTIIQAPTRGIEGSRSPQENFSNKAINPDGSDKLKQTSIQMGSKGNVIDTCQYSVQHVDFSPPASSSAPKRSRQEEKWAKNVAKKKRNLGIEYFSQRTQKIVAARKVGPPCTCARQCYVQLGQDMIQELFTNYWNLGDWGLQTAYLKQSTVSSEVKTHRVLNTKSKPRKCSVKYLVKVSNRDTDLQVCKQGFCNMHGITHSRIDKALNSVTSTDQRGKHLKTKKIEESRVNLVVNHMINLEASISEREFAGQECVKSKKHMYEIYKEWLNEYYPEEVPVSLHFYLDTLRSTLPNLTFPIYGTEINYDDSLRCGTNVETLNGTDIIDPAQHCVVNIKENLL